MSQQQTIRRIVWTGSIAAVTATGAWYGAGLKTNSEIRQNKERRREATADEQIAQLEQYRGTLIAKKIGLERKIAEIEMRKKGATREESMVGRERRS